MHILPTPEKTPLGHIETQPNNHGAENYEYVSNSGYVMPATAKKSTYDYALRKHNKLFEEKTLQEAEANYRKFYKKLLPYVESGIITIGQTKPGERSANVYINTNIEPGTPYRASKHVIPREASNLLIVFGLQKGNLYNFPYLTFSSLLKLQGKAERTIAEKQTGGYATKTFTKTFKKLEKHFTKEAQKFETELTSQLFANLLYIARNVKTFKLTHDVQLWIDALQENYTEDELWFALSESQVSQAGGKIDPQVVKNYKTYLYLLNS